MGLARTTTMYLGMYPLGCRSSVTTNIGPVELADVAIPSRTSSCSVLQSNLPFRLDEGSDGFWKAEERCADAAGGFEATDLQTGEAVFRRRIGKEMGVLQRGVERWERSWLWTRRGYRTMGRLGEAKKMKRGHCPASNWSSRSSLIFFLIQSGAIHRAVGCFLPTDLAA
jgi:hypothetical protein